MLGAWWSRIRNRLYDENYIAAFRPEAFVISVGNLTWGGTGKTTLVKQIAASFLQRGNSVAILSRGYGRSTTGPLLISDGKKIHAGWKEAGEEAYWLARRLPEAAVAVGEDRAAAVEKLSGIPVEVIVLDDGFQHRRFARDLDLVLIDASENLTKLNVIPFGKLREPLEALRRADAIVLTHFDQADPETIRWILEHFQQPVFHANYRIADHGLAGKRIAAFCAIGAPHHFFHLLESQNARLVFQKSFRDHHIYTEQELEKIERDAIHADAEVLVTTEKDAVKLQAVRFRLPLQTISAELVVTEGQKFESFLLNRPVAVQRL